MKYLPRKDGSLHHRAKDLTGLRVGYLTAMRYAGTDGRRSLWQVECDCGVTKLMQAQELVKQSKKGVTASCGCQRKVTIASKKKTHGMSKHKAFAVWRSMCDRCSLPSHQAWANYGGRGIKVCSRWQSSFQNFWEDMGPTYGVGLTLDRTDNNGDYSPENCRWVTHKRQARNKRPNVLVDTKWGLITVAEASEQSGIGRSTLHYRLSVGVTGAELFSPPDTTRKFSIW